MIPKALDCKPQLRSLLALAQCCLAFCLVRTISCSAEQDTGSFEYCFSNRHLHLSSTEDPSTSIIVSFSSHPCDIFIREVQKRRGNHPKGLIDNIKRFDYSSYDSLQPNRGGVVLSQNRHDVNNFGNILNRNSIHAVNGKNRDLFLFYDDESNQFGRINQKMKSRINRYNATILWKKQRIQYFSEYQHHIVIGGLKPNTRYYYKCFVEYQELPKLVMPPPTTSIEFDHQSEDLFDDDYYNDDNLNNDTSHHHHHHAFGDYYRKLISDSHDVFDIDHHKDTTAYAFKTAPTIHGGSVTRVAILADLGVFDHTIETLRALASNKKKIDFIILAGDISYANGFHPIWDRFFDMLDEVNIFRNRPLFVAAGNHDVEGHVDTGEIFTSYEARFLMPQRSKAEIGLASKKQDFDLNKMYKLKYDFGNSYYSFRYGPSYNIVLNAFADFEPDSKQYQWLLNELIHVDRNDSPWLAITVHCPLYSTFSQHHNDPQLLNLKKFLEPLFVTYKVNFVFSGHLHGYMRTKPVAFSNVTKNGPVHFVLGNGGRQANAPFLNPQPEVWVEIRDHTTYGYGFIEYINYTTARYEWVQTGHNKPGDRGKNFLDVPQNLTDIVYFQNSYFDDNF